MARGARPDAPPGRPCTAPPPTRRRNRRWAPQQAPVSAAGVFGGARGARGGKLLAYGAPRLSRGPSLPLGLPPCLVDVLRARQAGCCLRTCRCAQGARPPPAARFGDFAICQVTMHTARGVFFLCLGADAPRRQPVGPDQPRRGLAPRRWPNDAVGPATPSGKRIYPLPSSTRVLSSRTNFQGMSCN